MMRFLASVTLIWALAVTTSLCAGAWCTPQNAFSHQCKTCDGRGMRKAAAPFASDDQCSKNARTPDAKCGFQRLGQTAQMTLLRASKISVPLRIATGKLPARFDSAIILSSIGPPQTDRGPPLS